MGKRRARGASVKVGITIAPTADVAGSLWSNGIFQNIVYLALCLNQIERVEVALVAYPFGNNPLHPIGTSFSIPTINTAEAANDLDVIIELGIRLEKDFTEPFRAKGGKLVGYMAGNSMVMSFESVFLPFATARHPDGLAARAEDLKPGGAERGAVIQRDGFDAVWITPQHWHMNEASTRMLSGPPFCAPHIWAPLAIDHASKSLGIDATFKGRPDAWSCATFDPNINVVKSFHFPLLVAEAAYRREPEQIRRMMLFCTEHLKGRAHVESFIGATDLGKAGKVTAEGRHGIVSMLGSNVDAVITHQWENELNYLYWDTLYLGYPLIHNSAALGKLGAGYYYPDFSPEVGGEALLRALHDHVGPSEADLAATWAHHATNPENVLKYDFLLDGLLTGHYS